MQEILDAIQETKARRLVIDSLAGFKMALSPGFRADFRESLYRMIYSLTGAGVTVMSTLEMEESYTQLLFSTFAISFRTDDIIRMRCVEIESQMRRVVMVLKMRGGNHSKDIREYEIASNGLVIGERLSDYNHLITEIPKRTNLHTAKK